uniref:DNA packaging protein n=1 Tax=uncultured marine virus TaxID=186617 RepID=A0A0F7L908_9VIRU|nr:DNA packaging protein [uncultured marine virus]
MISILTTPRSTMPSASSGDGLIKRSTTSDMPLSGVNVIHTGPRTAFVLVRHSV